MPSTQATCFGGSTVAASGAAAVAVSSVAAGGETDEETMCMTAGVTVSVLVVLAICSACGGPYFKPVDIKFLGNLQIAGSGRQSPKSRGEPETCNSWRVYI